MTFLVPGLSLPLFPLGFPLHDLQLSFRYSGLSLPLFPLGFPLHDLQMTFLVPGLSLPLFSLFTTCIHPFSILTSTCFRFFLSLGQ
jgi:hypothetical protein